MGSYHDASRDGVIRTHRGCAAAWKGSPPSSTREGGDQSAVILSRPSTFCFSSRWSRAGRGSGSSEGRGSVAAGSRRRIVRSVQNGWPKRFHMQQHEEHPPRTTRQPNRTGHTLRLGACGRHQGRDLAGYCGVAGGPRLRPMAGRPSALAAHESSYSISAAPWMLDASYRRPSPSLLRVLFVPDPTAPIRDRARRNRDAECSAQRPCFQAPPRPRPGRVLESSTTPERLDWDHV